MYNNLINKTYISLFINNLGLKLNKLVSLNYNESSEKYKRFNILLCENKL